MGMVATPTAGTVVADDQFHVKAATGASHQQHRQHDNDAASATTSPFVGFVSGCMGAVALVYVGQPLDTIKVRMQLSSTAVVAESVGRTGGVSMWNCMRDMWRQAGVPSAVHAPVAGPVTAGGTAESVRALPTRPRRPIESTTPVKMTRMARLLYAGTAAALLANVAENGVLFAAYGPCQRLVSFACEMFSNRGTLGAVDKHAGDLSPLGMATAGSLAAFCSAFALCPTELIKVRLQAADLEASAAYATVACSTATATSKPTGSTAATSTLQVVRQVWTTEGGLRGMYRGFGSTVAREMPGYYVFFLAYEASRKYLSDVFLTEDKTSALIAKPPSSTSSGGGHGGGHDEDPSWITMIAGAAAGTSLWIVVYPIDAVKSRIQAQSSSGTGANFSPSSSFLHNVAEAIRRDGLFSLYRGLAPTLIRTVPASAVMFWTVERTKTLLTSFGL